MDLVGDIGGTHSRFGIVADGRIEQVLRYDNRHFTDLQHAIRQYLGDVAAPFQRPRRAALCVAAPVLGDEVQMMNIDWHFSQLELQRAFHFASLTVVNDFAAVAWSLAALGEADLLSVRPGTADPRGPRAVLGPGTGLGIATLVPCGGGWTVLAGEGGHVTLAAADSEESAALALIRRDYGHCSAERVLSGPGLINLHLARAELNGVEAPAESPEELTRLALAGNAPAADTLEMFFRLLGTVASDLALTVGASGGVYLAGGILPALQAPLLTSGFKTRFIEKGRYRQYLQRIPCMLITYTYPALVGLSTLLEATTPAAARGDTI